MDGAWCISPLPLDNSAKLRFQVLDSDRQKFSRNYPAGIGKPVFCGTLPRVTFDGMKLANVYEIYLPRERQPVADDRAVISGGIGGKEKTSFEVQQVLRYLGRL
jgi:hypothetical protein